MERYPLSVNWNIKFFKVAILTKLVYRLNAIIKTPADFLTEIEQLNLKFSWKWRNSE